MIDGDRLISKIHAKMLNDWFISTNTEQEIIRLIKELQQYTR